MLMLRSRPTCCWRYHASVRMAFYQMKRERYEGCLGKKVKEDSSAHMS